MLRIDHVIVLTNHEDFGSYINLFVIPMCRARLERWYVNDKSIIERFRGFYEFGHFDSINEPNKFPCAVSTYVSTIAKPDRDRYELVANFFSMDRSIARKLVYPLRKHSEMMKDGLIFFYSSEEAAAYIDSINKRNVFAKSGVTIGESNFANEQLSKMVAGSFNYPIVTKTCTISLSHGPNIVDSSFYHHFVFTKKHARAFIYKLRDGEGIAL